MCRFNLVRESLRGSLLLLLCAAPGYAQDYRVEEATDAGSIVGRVFFAGDYPKPAPLNVPAAYQMHCGKTKPNEVFIVSPTDKGLQSAVVYLKGVKAGKPFPKITAKLEQRECLYVPHIQVVPTNTTLEIINQDNTRHNVHSYLDPEGKRTTLFNLAQPTKGKKNTAKLSKAGTVKIACDIHRWMSAYVLVRDNPYYAVTKEDGSFEITGVPPGEYQLVLWHEGLGEGEKTVTVNGGETAEVSFPIGKASK